MGGFSNEELNPDLPDEGRLAANPPDDDLPDTVEDDSEADVDEDTSDPEPPPRGSEGLPDDVRDGVIEDSA